MFDAGKYLRQVEGFHRHAHFFQQFFAVAHGVKTRRTRTNRADAYAFHGFHYPADLAEALQVGGKHFAGQRANVLSGQGKRDPVLAKVVAQGNLAAEAVTAGGEAHFIEIIFFRLDQHRHVKAG